MATATPAPADQNLEVKCGEDWSFSVALVDPTSGNPIAITSCRMDIRQDSFSSARLIVSPACTQASNVATATLTSAATKAIQTQVGRYDFFAVRADNNNEVCLAQGSVSFTGAVTAL